MDKDILYTKSKCPKQDLHLVAHHIGNDKGKQAYRNGYTIVKNLRFINVKNGHWPLRVELEPIFDKIRNTRTYIVTKNEFG